MRRKNNLEVLVQILLLLGMAGVLLAGMITGKVNYYIHPRYHLGIWFSIAVLILFAVRLLTEIKKGRHNVNLKPYILFIIPLMIAFLFPASEVTNAEVVIPGGGSSASAGKGTSGSADSEISDEESSYSSYEEIYEEAQALDGTDASALSEEEYSSDTGYSSEEYETAEQNDTGSEVSDLADNYTEDSQPSDMSEKYTGKTVDGATVIEDDYFASWFYDVYDNMEDFIGKRYQFLAQVYSMDDLKENQFLAGRYVMVCCAADVTAYGMICETDTRSELKDDEWITVTATIGTGEYDGSTVPVLTEVTISKAKTPKDEYVYYNFY